MAQEIAALREKSPTIDPEDVVALVTSVMDSMKNDRACDPLKVQAEIEDLASYIKTAREDIAAICPTDITDEHLPSATDELDAIVMATESATNGIFEAVESIESIAADLPPETSAKITEQVTAVYEACGFQDITGQRIGKVVKTLKYIEMRVEEILSAFSEDQIDRSKKAERKKPEPTGKERPDEHLMSGPQQEGEAISQADVDALFG